MKQYWIYKITNIKDGKVYIGSSLNVMDRKNNHFRNLLKNVHRNSHLQRAYNLCGRGNFLFDIIEVGDYNFSFTELLLKEDKWVLHYDSLNPDKGYNKVLPSSQVYLKNATKLSREGFENLLLTKGPTNLIHMSKEDWITKRKNNPLFSLRRERVERGKLLVRKKPVVSLNTITKEIKHYPSIKECSIALQVGEKLISKITNQNIPNCQYHKLHKKLFIVLLEYFKEDVVIKIKPRKQRPKKEIPIKDPIVIPIIKIQNLDTLEIKGFNQYTEIAKFLNTNPVKIMELKRGWRNKGKGIIQKITHFKRWVLL